MNTKTMDMECTNDLVKRGFTQTLNSMETTTQLLEHGDYCEVTREQAVELLTIEGYPHPEHYAGYWFEHAKGQQYVWIEGNNGVVLSGIIHGNMSQQLPFPDFKQRLVNTVKNGIK